MFYIFSMDYGISTQCEIGVRMEKVIDFKRLIQERWKMNVDDLVLLTYAGEVLQDERTVCSYSVGTEQNPVFFFCLNKIDKLHVDSSSTRFEPSNYNPTIQSFKNERASKELLTNMCKLGLKILNDTEKEANIVETFSKSIQLLTVGWTGALRNLYSTANELEVETNKAFIIYRKHLSNIECFRSTVDGLQKALNLMEIIPFLIQTKEDFSEKSFFDWIQENYKSNEVEELVRVFKYALQLLDEEKVKNYEISRDKMIQDSKDEYGLIFAQEEMLYSIEEICKHSRSATKDQISMNKALVKSRDKIYDLCLDHDSTIIETLCESGIAQLMKMKDQEVKVQEGMTSLKSEKLRILNLLQQKKSWLAKIQTSMKNLTCKLQVDIEFIKWIENHDSFLKQLKVAHHHYIAFLMETLRRKTFSSLYFQLGKTAKNLFENLREEEVSQREVFSQQFTPHFVQNLFPDLTEVVPSFISESFNKTDPYVSLKFNEEDLRSFLKKKSKFFPPHLSDQIKDSEARHKITKDLLKRVYKEFNEKSLAVTKDHLISVGAGDEDHFQLLGSIKEEDANKEDLPTDSDDSFHSLGGSNRSKEKASMKEDLHPSILKLQSEKKHLSENQKKYLAEKEDLEETLKDLEDHNKKLSKKVEKVEDENEMLITRANNILRKYQDTNFDLEQLHVSSELALNKLHQDHSRKIDKIQKEYLDAMKKLQKSIKTSEKEKKISLEQLEISESHIQKLEKQLTNREDELMIVKSDVMKLNKSVSEYQKMMQELRFKEEDFLQKEQSDERVKEDLKKKIEVLESKNSRLQNDLGVFEKQFEVNETKLKLVSELQKNCDDLRENLKNSEVQRSKLEEQLKEVFTQIKIQKEDHKKELNSFDEKRKCFERESLEEYEKKLKELEEEKQKMKEDLTSDHDKIVEDLKSLHLIEKNRLEKDLEDERATQSSYYCRLLDKARAEVLEETRCDKKKIEELNEELKSLKNQQKTFAEKGDIKLQTKRLEENPLSPNTRDSNQTKNHEILLEQYYPLIQQNQVSSVVLIIHQNIYNKYFIVNFW